MTPQDRIQPLTTRRRGELLAAADRTSLIALGDRCLDGMPNPLLVKGPEVGMIVLTVREPVELIRFHLGEVLTTRSEVEHRGQRGWAMRMGDDRTAALAAAICDAEAEANGPLALEITHLCEATASVQIADRAREWEQLSPTIVSFQEMGE